MSTTTKIVRFCVYYNQNPAVLCLLQPKSFSFMSTIEPKSCSGMSTRTKILQLYVYYNQNPAVLCLLQPKSCSFMSNTTKILQFYVYQNQNPAIYVYYNQNPAIYVYYNQNPAILCLLQPKSCSFMSTSTKILQFYVYYNQNPAVVCLLEPKLYSSKTRINLLFCYRISVLSILLQQNNQPLKSTQCLILARIISHLQNLST